MTHFTRKTLYELVWSQPMRTVAASIGVSDVAVAKACRKANIPVPERGYWARKQANKPTVTRKLPPRFPGAPEEIEVGAGRKYRWGRVWSEIPLSEPIPPAPTFEEDMAVVIDRVRSMVGKVVCPKELIDPHPLIAPLLERDEKRRAEYVKTGHSWYEPLYDSPLEKRRLRIWNAIFHAVQRMGCKPYMNTSEHVQEREPSVQVGDMSVRFNLDALQSKRGAQKGNKQNDRLRLTLGWNRGDPSSKSWEDTDDQRLERLLTEVVTEIVVTGERLYRQGHLNHHAWLVERRAEMEAEIRRKKAEAEQRARELRAKEEKDRIDRLLDQARALDQSTTIRAYVAAVRCRASELPLPNGNLERWATWALQEADRIDPVKNGTVVVAVRALEDAVCGEGR